MAYDDDEDAGGDPVELFKLVGPGALAWYLTSDTASHTYDGHTYTPAAIAASELVSVGTIDPQALVVRIPGDHEVSMFYGFGSPPRSLTLTVYRKQTGGDVREIWTGSIPNVSPEGDWTELRCPSLVADRLEIDAPGWAVQRQCNNRVYDSICGVTKAAPYTVSTTIASVATGGNSITVASVGGHVDNYFAGGDAVRTTDGEARMITSQVGSVLTLHAPFRTISAGDAVTIAAGCDGLASTCRDKFSNVDAMTGTPFVPTSRLFATRLQR